MVNKKISAILIAIVLFVGIWTAALAANGSDSNQSSDEYGNLTSVLLNGGYAADYADGMVVFADTENSGYLTLKNTFSGNKSVINNENASYINVIGNSIFYVTSDGNGHCIVKTNLSSDREILVISNEEIKNLFVSQESMYYLKGNSVIEYVFADSTESVVYSNPQMKAFVPEEDGIYWFKEKPEESSVGTKYGVCCVDALEGTEDEPVDYDCYLFDPQLGKNVKTNINSAVQSDAAVNPDLSSLAVTAKIGDVSLPTDEYPVGSYFTDSGEGCTDHRTGVCGWEAESLCNCKSSHNGVKLKSVQCFAFARYVYNECFGEIGSVDSRTSTNIGTIPQGSVTEENFKALIRQTRPGAQIRVKYIKSDGVTISTHSMIILDWNDSGFSVLESNVDGKCGVGVRRIAFSQYLPTVLKVEYLMMPNDYPETEEETTDATTTAPSESESGSSDSTTKPEQLTQITNPSHTEPSEEVSDFYSLILMMSEKIFGFFAKLLEMLLIFI